MEKKPLITYSEKEMYKDRDVKNLPQLILLDLEITQG